jgi:AraC-like DNA-binding protein
MVDHVHAWHPSVPGVREIYHATFEHAYPMHAHDGWTVMIVDAGAVSYDLHRAGHVAAPRAVTLLPPGIPHDGRSVVDGQPYRKRVIYTDGDWLPERAADRAATNPTLAGAEPLAVVKRIHAALREPGDVLAAEHWMLTLRGSLLDHLDTPGVVPSDAPLARRVRVLLDERITESFTLAQVAVDANAHPSHLIRAFSREFGLAPHQYVVSRRVDIARRMLVDGIRPAAASVEAGFHDQAHLTRHFRRILGTTPAAFAASHRASKRPPIDR